MTLNASANPVKICQWRKYVEKIILMSCRILSRWGWIFMLVQPALCCLLLVGFGLVMLFTSKKWCWSFTMDLLTKVVLIFKLDIMSGRETSKLFSFFFFFFWSHFQKNKNKLLQFVVTQQLKIVFPFGTSSGPEIRHYTFKKRLIFLFSPQALWLYALLVYTHS